MILHRDGGTRRDAAAIPSGLAQLGHSLRRSRVSQGLGVADAARGCGVSVAEIEALEAAQPARLPDAVHTVNLLRRYAESLGLPADRYALALLDAWPTRADAGLDDAYRAGANGGGLLDLGQATAGGQLTGGEPGASNGGASGFGPDHPSGPATTVTPPPVEPTGTYSTVGEGATSEVSVRRAGDGTAQMPPVGTSGIGDDPWSTAVGTTAAGQVSPTGAVPSPLATDEVPAYSGGQRQTGPVARATARRPPRNSAGGVTLLRVLVVVLSVLVAAAAAGLVIDHWKPQWLRSLAHGQSAPPSPAPTTASSGNNGGGAAGSSGRHPSHTSGHSSVNTVSAAVPSSSDTATVTVGASGAIITVSASGGTSWVQVQRVGNYANLFAGSVDEGTRKSFPLTSSVTVQVGSAAARVAVGVGGKVVRTYTPTTAPYTYTFNTG